MYDLKYDRNILEVIIDKEDYDKVMNIKTIYDIEVIDGYGFIKTKSKIKVNLHLIILIIISLIVIQILTSFIYEVEVIYNSKETRNFIKTELENYGIKKYEFKKNYNEIQKIKEDILLKYKDKIEWLEIENQGMKYIVKLELRKIIENNIDNNYKNIIAKKDGIIKKIESTSGDVKVEINDYVKKGDVLISGEIKLNDNIKGYKSASGNVYAEVWYTVDVTYPYHYKEKKETGNINNALTFKFLNHSYNFKNYNNYISKEKTILKQFPFSLVLEEQRELEIIDNLYTEDEVIMLAKNKARNQIISKLKENEYIIDEKILLINIKNSKIELKVFFSVLENIKEEQIIGGLNDI